MQEAEAIPSRQGGAYTRGMEHPDPDVRLMLRYREGDPGAFDSLYVRHKDGLYRYLLRLCPDRHTAEDLFQESWSKLIAARARYRPTARFSTYLYRIAHNCFVDHYRRLRSRGVEQDAGDAVLISPVADPDEQAERSLARAHLDRLLSELPTEQREAFLLREEGDLSLAEIGDITGVGTETAKSRLRYAYRKLREGFQALATGLEESDDE